MSTLTPSGGTSVPGTQSDSPLGLTKGQVVQEIGYDEDVDFDLREAVEDAIDDELVDEDWDDVTDAALIWWRDGDGDLTDTIVDALALLEAGGVVWVLTPKPGRSGYVEASEIAEAANIAGLHIANAKSVGKDWTGTRLTPRGRPKK
jgi:hypothetical protein